MPFTFLSHQAAVMPLVRRFPRLDAAALLVGSMAPDLSYAFFGRQVWLNGHSLTGIVAFGVPATVVLVVVLRDRLAAVALGHFPDCGPLRMRSWAAHAHAPAPPAGATLLSALIGAWTHLVWDSFTHDDRFGPNTLEALTDVWLTVGGRDVRGYLVLQYLSTFLGAVVTLWYLARMARDRVPERRYGQAAVDAVRRFRPDRLDLVTFYALVTAGAAGATTFAVIDGRNTSSTVILFFFGALGGGFVASRFLASPADVPLDPGVEADDIDLRNPADATRPSSRRRPALTSR